MRQRILHDAGTLRGVRDFLVATDITVAAGSIAPLVTRLSGIIDTLAAHAIDQDSQERAVRGTTQVIRTLDRTLREEYLRPIAQIAPSLFRNDPELRAALELPRFRDYGRLLGAAASVAEQVDANAQRFVVFGFAPDFAARLRGVADELRRSLDNRAQQRGRRTAATAGQVEALRDGRTLVRLLDTMIRPRLRPRPAELAAWRTVTHFARRTRGERLPTVAVGQGTDGLSLAA